MENLTPEKEEKLKEISRKVYALKRMAESED